MVILLLCYEEYGYSVRGGKGSHRGATVKIAEKVWTLTFVEAHEGKFMHHKDVDRLLKQIDEIEAWQAELENEEGDDD